MRLHRSSRFGSRPSRLTRFLCRAILAAPLVALSLAAPVRAQQNDFAVQAGTFDSIGDAPSFTTQLTTTPTSPISRSGRYFLYGGQTVALVGISGEYIPHLSEPTNYPDGTVPYQSYCTYDLVSGKLKYQRCLDLLQTAGINKIRLWVAFNFPATPVSQPHDAPFLKTGSQWDLTQYDSTYFTNLFNVVQYAQSKGIIVEVTLFVPMGGDATMGPWWSTNNTEAGIQYGFRTTCGNVATENSAYFWQAQDPTANPFTAAAIDTSTCINTLRNDQIALMRKVVDTLTSLNNFYFELANEADLSGTSFPSFANMTVWHNYMARKLWEYENTKGRHHLIAANYATSSTINDAASNATSKIDIINGHYVNLKNNVPGALVADRYSAIKLLNTYNAYGATGAPAANNTKIWGFNETRITGIGDNRGDPATADSARAEAWEFLMNGGGVYDHFSYNWGNPSGSLNNVESNKARTQLGLLSKFLGTLNLGSMHRSTPNQSTFWVTVPTYGSIPAAGDPNYFWAAMEGTSRVLYIHHSRYSVHVAGKYDPAIVSGGYHESLSVKNLNNSIGSCVAAFKAEWYLPNGTYLDASGNLATIPTSTFNFNWSVGQTVTLPNSPAYDYDILLKVTQTGTCP